MNPYLATVLAYAIGSVSFALVAARIKGVDLREHGSGNPGATNVGRVLGRGWGLVVLALDVLKGLVPVLVLRGPDWLDPSGRVVILVAAVVGHVYPITLGLRGGKGVATLIGGYFALDWKLALVAIAVHFGLRRMTGFVSAASVALAWAFPAAQLVVLATGVQGYFTGGTAGIAGLAALITWRHRSNFQRIRAGAEDRYDDRP